MDINDSYNIKTVERAFQILDLACDKGSPISIQDVSTALNCNTNMAFRLLTTIQQTGYLDKDPYTGLYILSVKCLKLTTNSLQSIELRKMAMPYLELLWNQYPKCNVNLGVLKNNDVIMVERIETNTASRTYFTPGRTIPFHCTGMGKLLVSFLPDDQIDEIIKEKGLKKFTADTIVNVEDIKEELKRVRTKKIGTDRNEFIEGDNCSAAPIFDRNNNVVAAISMSALEQNMTVEEMDAAIPQLRETASKISAMLGYYSY